MGETAKQIGQQARDLCGVGTAPLSLTVYLAVYFKTEISMQRTAAVNYGLWLGGSQGHRFQSATRKTAPSHPVQVGKMDPGRSSEQGWHPWALVKAVMVIL